jgi:hypothetical protein
MAPLATIMSNDIVISLNENRGTCDAVHTGAPVIGLDIGSRQNRPNAAISTQKGHM